MPTDPTSDLDLPLSQSPPKAAQPSPPLKVSESSPRTANRLTLPQTFALGAWIKEHEQQAKDEPDTQAAQHAALDLGFTVTAANFTAARQALGIDKTKPTAPPTIEDRLLALETDVNLRATAFRREIDDVIADILLRLQTLESQSPPVWTANTATGVVTIQAGQTANEIRDTPSDTECPTPSAN